ncbi:hypothetical protein QBC34DRAFT_403339 [Podospora aff. communis PSN243]|uniref:Clr5 domain-containing protein n=1 Tax=Podospora aff. communis PSN243 TaxID=3040156 RepID=A0AAV9GPY4_9PEZI|nr:hypothetical protein QBC34DRAFT_403339 [Podospora aff. communis PSN243]
MESPTSGAGYIDPRQLVLRQRQPQIAPSHEQPDVSRLLAVHGCEAPPPMQQLASPNEGVKKFDAFKPAIERLYLNLNLPANDVIQIMKKNHAFSATRKMYASQFRNGVGGSMADLAAREQKHAYDLRKRGSASDPASLADASSLKAPWVERLSDFVCECLHFLPTIRSPGTWVEFPWDCRHSS